MCCLQSRPWLRAYNRHTELGAPLHGSRHRIRPRQTSLPYQLSSKFILGTINPSSCLLGELVKTARGGSLQDQALVKGGGDYEEQEGGATQENDNGNMEGSPSTTTNRPRHVCSSSRQPSRFWTEPFHLSGSPMALAHVWGLMSWWKWR